MTPYEKIADLPLTIDGYALESLEHVVSPRFTRRTTVVRLEGAGASGYGEDVTYAPFDQARLVAAGPALDLAQRGTFDDFSRRLDELELFPVPPELEDSRDFRRWAFESAALDLALRQAGRSLSSALGCRSAPVRFVLSLGLGSPPSLEPVHRRLAADPEARFKLDASPEWTPELMDALAETDAVDVVDLKGRYVGTPVDQPADARLYAEVAARFPGAWIEDPALTPETRAVLAEHLDRVTWDAPLHSLADLEACETEPRCINVKPSRFGTVRELLAVYERCEERGIACYGGGQFELGPGREQIQLLAGLFHADAPNDVAPSVYHAASPPANAPRSPLEAAADLPGFRRS